MNSASQKEWDDEQRKKEWKEGVRKLQFLVEKMRKEEVDKSAFWEIQLLIREDLWKIFSYGRINAAYEERKTEEVTPFQRVAAHPKGALAILRFLRGIIANDEREKELAMYEVTDIYEEIFDEPAMMPRFLAEMLHGL